LCSFDIENIYINITTKKAKNIIFEILNRNSYMPEEDKKELVNLLSIVLEQNYLQFNNQYYKQGEGLTVGTPTSAIIAEAYPYIQPSAKS
jgi:hypothetical protein